MICDKIEDLVADDEHLYRRVPNIENFFKYQNGLLRISSSAFNDRSDKPSVDRAKLRNFNPSSTKKAHTDGIVTLLTQDIREEKIDVNPAQSMVTTIQTYLMDVEADPITDTNEINLAHALIITHPDFTHKNHFRKVKERLAILASKHGWVIEPGEKIH